MTNQKPDKVTAGSAIDHQLSRCPSLRLLYMSFTARNCAIVTSEPHQSPHYTISRPLNSYTGKLVVQSQTFYDLRTNIPVLSSWSFDIRVLNGLQIALSNSGYKLLSDSLSSPLLSRGWDRGNFPLDGEERYNLDSSILSPQVGVCLFSFSAGCFSRDEKWQKCHGDKKRKCAVTGWCVLSPQTLT